MSTDQQRAKAATLRALYEDDVLVLPNAWDAGSAAVIAAAGVRAIATTSAGVSWALGYPDGQNLSRAQAVTAIGRIVRSVEIPVTADIEGGYGPAPEDVAATVRAVIEAGAVGINLEDSLAPGGPLHDADAQSARIRAARQAAQEAGVPDLVINARTDVFLFGIGEEAGRLDDVASRAAAYAEAGADGLFVPGLLDLNILAELANRTPLPLNVMAGPGAPDVEELRKAGVRRVSVGSAISQAAYGLAKKAATEILASGTYTTLNDAEDFGALNSAFPVH
ncbi:isocitrate lyase/phosphoenolpyruvate mutase family protein [Streptomyces sp. AK02-01A]|uniref:isocitrate lyase/PEP mutase family protein n=1 Tax=Streptomyces sp. AK02-01A TaxID=3028648 RepID=UPI0029A67B21|nr:isocitrate lyase/phosphoenolpyruvate mutase family protein [Streptomyces sp. AK02-01A]MDX3854897.1 isocitrate lyase/phosphoenolpyruvate mutase family protein [Streptomyces sp. AK02-01A]